MLLAIEKSLYQRFFARLRGSYHKALHLIILAALKHAKKRFLLFLPLEHHRLILLLWGLLTVVVHVLLILSLLYQFQETLYNLNLQLFFQLIDVLLVGVANLHIQADIVLVQLFPNLLYTVYSKPFFFRVGANNGKHVDLYMLKFIKHQEYVIVALLASYVKH